MYDEFFEEEDETKKEVCVRVMMRRAIMCCVVFATDSPVDSRTRPCGLSLLSPLCVACTPDRARREAPTPGRAAPSPSQLALKVQGRIVEPGQAGREARALPRGGLVVCMQHASKLERKDARRASSSRRLSPPLHTHLPPPSPL